MKILPINNLNSYNTRSNSKVSQKHKTSVVQFQNSVSFNGNYKQTYLNALKTTIKDTWDCRYLFDTLRKAVLTEKLSIEARHYINQDFRDLLSKAEGVNSEIILAKSNNYNSPLMTLRGGAINFHHPDYGEFGNGNISFFLDGSTTMLKKDHYAVGGDGVEYFEFWNSGNIRRYSKTCEGTTCEDIKYNEDGSKKRGFFDILFGD